MNEYSPLLSVFPVQALTDPHSENKHAPNSVTHNTSFFTFDPIHCAPPAVQNCSDLWKWSILSRAQLKDFEIIDDEHAAD